MQVLDKNNMFISKLLIISSCSMTIVVLVGLYLAVVFAVAGMSAVADMVVVGMVVVGKVADMLAVGMAVDIGNLVVITAGVGGWFYFLLFPLVFSSSAGLPSPHPSPKLSPPAALPPSLLSFPPLSPLP
jgi:hypothetical protein